MRRVAAIDCGTNSIRLLISAVGSDGTLSDVERVMRINRLGQGVDATGRLAPDALERTFAAAREYAALVEGVGGVDALRIVATSATRDAANRSEFQAGMRAILGVEPEVVPGEVEAALSFAGATAGLAAAGYAGPYLVFDIGGGSTEFVLGDGAPQAARSVDVGCVRMRERRLHSDPASTEEIAAAIADVDAAIALAAAAVPFAQARSVVGVAGTVTTLVAMALGLDEYDSDRIHQARVSTARIREIGAGLLASTSAERARIGVMHSGRVDVIGAGALVLDRVLHALGDPDLIASEHDILDGIAAGLAS
ncbi:MAG: Ppx/GppA phosphatase family protein [Sporichthyaceae bacterium]